MSAGFTRFFGWVVIVGGLLVMLAGVLAAGFIWRLPADTFTLPAGAGSEAMSRGFLSAAFGIVGFLVGAPLVVFGQLMLVFLDMRRQLVRLNARLRRRRASNDRVSRLTERLRHRPI